MHEALLLLERAARCREIAEDYHAEIGAPLIALADDLEERAYRLQPSLSAGSRLATGRTNFAIA